MNKGERGARQYGEREETLKRRSSVKKRGGGEKQEQVTSTRRDAQAYGTWSSWMSLCRSKGHPVHHPLVLGERSAHAEAHSAHRTRKGRRFSGTSGTTSGPHPARNCLPMGPATTAHGIPVGGAAADSVTTLAPILIPVQRKQLLPRAVATAAPATATADAAIARQVMGRATPGRTARVPPPVRARQGGQLGGHKWGTRRHRCQHLGSRRRGHVHQRVTRWGGRAGGTESSAIRIRAHVQFRVHHAMC